MDSRTRRYIRPMSVLLLGLLLAASAGAVAFGSQAGPPATPTDRPPAPTDEPTARPDPTTRAPTGSPQRTPVYVDRPHLFVDIVDAAGRDITIEIADGYATLADVRAGRAGDGMSVPYGQIAVTRLDGHTLQLTWAGQSTGDHILSIDPVSKTLRLSQPTLVEGDAIAFDRVLILEFVEPVAADEYEAILQTGFDT